MDDEDFEDLLAEVDILGDSSQESLTDAAANLFVDEHSNEQEGDYGTFHPTLTTAGFQDVENTRRDDFKEPVFLQSAHISPANTDLHSSQPSVKSGATVLEKIEAVFEGLVDSLQKEKNELTITLNTRPKASTAITGGTSANVPASSHSKTRIIHFPGKSAEEAWRFAVTVRVLELVNEALRKGVVLSKRDIYYRDPALFGSQNSVDRTVDDIAFTFDVPRQTLNIIAAAKGLLAGAITFCRRDGSFANAASDRDGMLVPNLREVLSVDMSTVKLIVVIEKEATFRSIAASKLWDNISARGVIMTGKGYPDIATRGLLHMLTTPTPQNGFASPPAFGLMDCDPDGLAIMSIYKDGSLASSHENAALRVPQLQWLGLRIEHMMIAGDDVHAAQGLLSLTKRDRKKAVKMLERCTACDSDKQDHDFQQALQHMLMLNTKAELQLLDAKGDGMANLLSSKLADL